MAATKSYVISVDSIPRSGLRHRRHLAANVIYAGQHTSPAVLAVHIAPAAAGRRNGPISATPGCASSSHGWMPPGWARCRTTSRSAGVAIAPRPPRYAAAVPPVPQESRRALIVRSGLTVLMVVFVAAVVAGAWFSTSGAVAFASIVQP